MRELAEEGRKAREAQAAANAPAAPPAPVLDIGDPLPEGEAYPWPYHFEPKAPTAGQFDLCHHGRELRDPCYECGRR
jgi:hypothetical protein